MVVTILFGFSLTDQMLRQDCSADDISSTISAVGSISHIMDSMAIRRTFFVDHAYLEKAVHILGRDAVASAFGKSQLTEIGYLIPNERVLKLIHDGLDIRGYGSAEYYRKISQSALVEDLRRQKASILDILGYSNVRGVRISPGFFEGLRALPCEQMDLLLYGLKFQRLQYVNSDCLGSKENPRPTFFEDSEVRDAYQYHNLVYEIQGHGLQDIMLASEKPFSKSGTNDSLQEDSKSIRAAIEDHLKLMADAAEINQKYTMRDFHVGLMLNPVAMKRYDPSLEYLGMLVSSARSRGYDADFYKSALKTNISNPGDERINQKWRGNKLITFDPCLD